MYLVFFVPMTLFTTFMRDTFTKTFSHLIQHRAFFFMSLVVSINRMSLFFFYLSLLRIFLLFPIFCLPLVLHSSGLTAPWFGLSFPCSDVVKCELACFHLTGEKRKHIFCRLFYVWCGIWDFVSVSLSLVNLGFSLLTEPIYTPLLFFQN